MVKFVSTVLLAMLLSGVAAPALRAQVLLPRTVELNPADMERDGLTVAQEALQLAQFQQFGDALVRAKLAAQLAPDTYEIWALLGGLYLTVGEPEEAITALERSLALNQENAGVYFNLGSAYFRTKDYGRSARAIEQGLTIKDDAPEEWFNLGNAYLMLNQGSRAIAQYRKAINLDKKFWPAFNNIGLIQYEQGNIRQAIQSWQTAVDIDSKASEPKLALATALFKQGQVTQALPLAEEAIQLDSRYATVEFQRENLWGDRLISDTQALLANPQLQAVVSRLQTDIPE